jgi:hypothetical protein
MNTQFLVLSHNTCRTAARQDILPLLGILKLTPQIQDNKNCHDDQPKTLAFQVSLRYHGFG